MKKIKTISILLIFLYIFNFIIDKEIVNIKTSALENNDIVETPELRPSFSDLNIDVDEALIVSYEKAPC